MGRLGNQGLSVRFARMQHAVRRLRDPHGWKFVRALARTLVSSPPRIRMHQNRAAHCSGDRYEVPLSDGVESRLTRGSTWKRCCSHQAVRCGSLSTAHLSSSRVVDLHHALEHDLGKSHGNALRPPTPTRIDATLMPAVEPERPALTCLGVKAAKGPVEPPVTRLPSAIASIRR